MKIYAVVINWNLKAVTADCLRSLNQAGLPLKQIILVDNGSEDGSVPYLRAKFPELFILETGENLGFAVGSNRGIEAALEQGAEWLALINNDTVVAPTFFSEFEGAFEQYPHYKILAPLIFYHDAPDKIWYLGDVRLPHTLITTSLHRNKPLPPNLPPHIPVDFVSGCGVLIHRSVFEQIGLFDPAFYMYGEDVDLYWRASQAGVKMLCLTTAQMWHKVSLSANSDKPAQRYWKIRNQIRVYHRYAQGPLRLLMILFTLGRSTLMSLRDALRGQKGLVSATWQGWLDGWRNSKKFSNEYIYGNNSL